MMRSMKRKKHKDDKCSYLLLDFPSECTHLENTRKVLTLENAARTHGF